MFKERITKLFSRLFGKSEVNHEPVQDFKFQQHPTHDPLKWIQYDDLMRQQRAKSIYNENKGTVATTGFKGKGSGKGKQVKPKEYIQEPETYIEEIQNIDDDNEADEPSFFDEADPNFMSLT